ncbi:hypothetical protein GE09DRAFT_1071604 [Coniochaeta sp. 2T2.1]|nr:hypothetical protein GE09DRAFT_1071604 [Coniochaeta sp. 2T2.1]
MKHGLRSILTKIPPDAGLDQYHELCSSMDYLCIDVLGRRGLPSIYYDLLRKDQNIIPTTHRGLPAAHRRVVRTARDSAFRLLYIFLMVDLTRDEVRYIDVNYASFATELALSASGPLSQTEGSFARVLRQAYEERFEIGHSQRCVVDNLLLFFDDAGYEAGSA